MNIAVLIHHHRHGTDHYYFKTNKSSFDELPKITIEWAGEHGIDFEPEQVVWDGECEQLYWIEIITPHTLCEV